jgi:hypothetical protein
MPFRTLELSQEIADLVAQFAAGIKAQNAIGLYDINRAAQNILIPVFREAYDFKHLRSLDIGSQTFPAVDLGDDVARTAIQITTERELEKIKHTLKMFVHHKLYERFDRLVIFILGEKQRSYSQKSCDAITDKMLEFNCNKDVLDFKDLLSQISTLPLERKDRIQQILRSEGYGPPEVVAFVDRFANEQADFVWNQAADRKFFIKRERQSQELRQILAAREYTVHVDGEAGSGKSMFVRSEFAAFVKGKLKHRQCSLFVDCIWLLESDQLRHTPLASLSSIVKDERSSIWDTLNAIADRLREKGVRITVFLDTVDAAAITKARNRVLYWLLEESATHGINVVATCRSLEAKRYLISGRNLKPLRLGDFSFYETTDAIRTYVNHFYIALSPVLRATAEEAIFCHLSNSQFSDICRRPVTLKMLFEAFPRQPPTQALNRSQLFDLYWRKKVRGEDADRNFRSSPVQRLKLVESVAMSCYRHCTVAVLQGDYASIVDSTVGGTEASDDLQSESVIATDNNGTIPYYYFFHQSFLEHAIARAILNLDKRQLDQYVDALLAPLHGAIDIAPNFVILQEIGVLSQYQDKTKEVGYRVFTELVTNESPDSRGIAALLWCRMPELPQQIISLKKEVELQSAFFYACLSELHNAPVSKIHRYVDALTAGPWCHGDLRLRLEVMQCLARVASLVPDSVRYILEKEDIHRIALSPRPGDEARPLIEKLIEIYGAFIGVEDAFACDRLNDIYTAVLMDGKRSFLVKYVGDRCFLSKSACQLLITLLWTHERRAHKSQRATREAFGVALAPLTDWLSDSVVRMGILESSCVEIRGRLLSILRHRVLQGRTSAADAFSIINDITTADHLGEISANLLQPLADDDVSGIVYGVVEALVHLLLVNTDGSGGLRKKHLLVALQRFVIDESIADYVLFASGLRAIAVNDLTDEEYSLLLICYRWKSTDVTALFANAVIEQDKSLRYLTIPRFDVAGLLPVLIFNAIRQDLTARQRKRITQFFAHFEDEMSDSLQFEVCEWLSDTANTGSSVLRSHALAILPRYLLGISNPTLRTQLVQKQSQKWLLFRRDIDAATLANFYAEVIAFSDNAEGFLDKLHLNARLILAERPTTSWKHTRLGAWRIIVRLSKMGHPVNVVELLDEQLQKSLSKEEAVFAASLVFSSLQLTTSELWGYSRRLSETLFEGTLAQRDLAAALRGGLKRCIADPPTRSMIISEIEGLNDIFQSQVVRELIKCPDFDSRSLSLISLKQRANHVLLNRAQH